MLLATSLYMPRVEYFFFEHSLHVNDSSCISYLSSVQVPSLWWHAVMNLDETVSFT